MRKVKTILVKTVFLNPIIYFSFWIELQEEKYFQNM